MGDIRSEFLFEITAHLGEFQEIGQTPRGLRRIVYVTGGQFEGPRLKGEVLPGGGDWLLARADGVGVLDVRATLRTDDGALIYITYNGYIDAPPDVWEKFVSEDVDPERYYFRTNPTFEVADERYAWLQKRLAIGVGRVHKGVTGVTYRVYAIL